MPKAKSSVTMLLAADQLEQAAALLRAVSTVFDGKGGLAASAANPSPPASGPPATSAPAPADSKKKLSRKETRAAIVAEIHRHPNRTNVAIAEAHGVTGGYVGKIRKQLTDEAAADSGGPGG